MCFSLHHKASKYDSYFLQSRLHGHSGGIVRLRATEDGRCLASGGTDGTKVWDLSTMRELGSPKSPEIRRASTALVWIKREDDLREGLFYGTQNGQLGLAVFEEISCVRVVNPAEITGLAFDAPSNCLAVCHRGGVVQVYALGSTMSLQEVFTLELKNFAPQAIAFGQMHGNERDVMVFGLYRGDIYTLRGSNGNVTGALWNVGAFIGDIALDTRKGVLCMDEPSSGTNLYRLEDHTGLLDKCKFIVSGSDHGIVYVFDRRSGHTVDNLRVDPHEWVQTVSAADCAGVSTIFAAKLRDLVGSNKIFVWRRKSPQRFGVAGIACGMGRGDLLAVLWRVVRSQTQSFAHAGALAELQPALIHIGARDQNLFRRCDVCPTCGSSLPTEHMATLVPAPAPMNDTGFLTAALPKLPNVVRRQTMALCEWTKHRADVQQFCENLAKLDVADDVSDIDNLANVFTGLVVTDDDPDVRGQQHSWLFSSWNDLRGSLPDVPLAFQPTSPSEAIASIESLVNTAPMCTAPPTRKERRESTLADILGRIRNAQNSPDLVYELYATNSEHDSARLALDAAAETVVAAGKLLRSVKASKNDKELAKLWHNVHSEAVALDKLVDCVGAIVPKAVVEVNEVEVEYNTEHHFEDPIGGHDTVAQIVM
ncbi:WD40-repeat-containing domain protein [Mycena capillaripes]|nr:WD40-repeat-containing domain protein [Mycena capillaripes]